MKLLQLTDTHIFKDRTKTLNGFNTFNMLCTVIDSVIENGEEFDQIILTGDLSQDNSEESYSHIKEQVERLKKPVLAICGNHDNPDLIDKYFPTKSVENETWNIYPLTSQIPGEIKGKIADSEKHIEVLKKVKKNVALICHHHLLPIDSEYMDQYIMVNGETFLKEISNIKNIKLIIHGHVHNDYEYEYENIKILATKATCFCFKKYAKSSEVLDDRGYRIIDLKNY